MTARIAHVNETLNTPTFAWIDASQAKIPAHATPVDVGWGTLRAVAKTLRLSDAAVANAQITNIHDIGSGTIITRFSQKLGGVDVFRSRLNVAMKRDLTPMAVTGSLAPSLQVLGGSWKIDEQSAVAAAYHALTKTGVSPSGFSSNGTDSSGSARYLFNVRDASGTSFVSARVKKVYYPQAKGVQASFYVELAIGNDHNTSGKLQSFVINGVDSSLLFTHNMTASDEYTYRVWADQTGPNGHWAPLDSPDGNGLTPNALGAYSASATEPQFLSSSLVKLSSEPFKTNDPWLPSGATELSGNNVHAYSDVVAPDGYTANSLDLLVTPTSAGQFDRTWDPNTIPGDNDNNTAAVTTNLFFIVNYMHDLFYDSGYDEASGAAQKDNYGRGGKDSDAINAESQDYSGVDNANCSTPSDGASPRIQMYLWDYVSKTTLQINGATPQTLVGLPLAWDAGALVYTGNVVQYQDNGAATSLGCVAPANAAALNGNIALIDRGTCNFSAKADFAFKAGAKGVIFANSSTGSFSGGVGDTTIAELTGFPSILISYTDGINLKTAVASGTVNVTINKQAPTRDGSVDGTIVSHEWGHSLSHRLIDDANGLNSNQSNGMGEGWSDFVALLTYIRPTDTAVAGNGDWSGVYPMGTYALGGTPADIYYGIRRYPYSRDKAIDPLTFTHIQKGVALPTTPAPAFTSDNSEVHNTGEIWTTMLWDCYTGLLRDTANYTFETASKQMRDYLVASLKLTPADPTFVEARDAWLLAAAANTAKPNDFMTFATAFAGRGIGAGAIAPPRYATDNVGVTESFAVGNDLDFVSATLEDDLASCDGDHVLDNGETGTLTVKIANSGFGALSAATVKVSSTNTHVSFPGGTTFTFPATALFASSSVKIPIALTGAADNEALDLSFTLDTPGIATGTPVGARAATASFNVNYDWVPASSATDSVDEPTTLWTASNDPNFPDAVDDSWARIPATPAGQLWFGDDTASGTSDLRLTSPALTVGSGAFSFSFSHHYYFENSKGAFYDGAVIEISTDGGANWTDIGASAAPGYTGTVAGDINNPTDPNDPSPLAGRQAFVGQSANYPADILTTVSLGTTYAGQTVQIRFRVGNDWGNGSTATGWFIDNIAFTGIVGTPFTALGPQSSTCSVPVAKIGADQTVTEGSTVTLDGSGSTAGAGKTIHYVWTQTAGPTVALSDATASKPTFTAPDVTADTLLTFQLVVNDGGTGVSAPATGNVTVQPMAAPPGDMGGAGGGGTGGGGGTAGGGGGKAGGGGTGGGGGTAGGGGAAGGGGGKHHSGCSATGSDAPTTALPLLGLLLLGLAFRRRTARS